MDELDAAIVDILQSNARITNKDLANQLGIAPSTCLERLRSLRRRGVIKGFYADVDLSRLGRHVEAMISVSLRPQSRAVIEGFRDFVLAQRETLAVYVVTGAEDILVHVGVENTKKLQEFVLDRLTRRPEIAGIKTAVVYEHRRNHQLFAVGEDSRA